MDITPNNFSIVPLKEKVILSDNPTEQLGSLYGGWLAESQALSNGKVRLEATNERILIGSATEPLTGVGIFIGSDKAGGYDFRAGDPSGNYIHWDASAATLRVNGIFNLGGTVITIGPTGNIQTNINTISAAGGGTLYLQAGTYSVSSNITVPSNISIIGAGLSTIIDFGNGAYQMQVVGSNNYSTGTVAIANDGTVVVGTGTTFTSGMVGRQILLEDFWYTIRGGRGEPQPQTEDDRLRRHLRALAVADGSPRRCESDARAVNCRHFFQLPHDAPRATPMTVAFSLHDARRRGRALRDHGRAVDDDGVHDSQAHGVARARRHRVDGVCHLKLDARARGQFDVL